MTAGSLGEWVTPHAANIPSAVRLKSALGLEVEALLER